MVPRRSLDGDVGRHFTVRAAGLVMPSVLVKPVVDLRVRGMCALPYEGHPRGCPNFGCSSRCPPASPLLYDAFDERGPHYAVYSSFPLGEHVERMRASHPSWSERQLRCVLYWQGTARKRLRAEVVAFRAAHPEVEWRVEETPEAMGLHVFETMRKAGVTLPWPPADIAIHVALAGPARR